MKSGVISSINVFCVFRKGEERRFVKYKENIKLKYLEFTGFFRFIFL